MTAYAGDDLARTDVPPHGAHVNLGFFLALGGLAGDATSPVVTLVSPAEGATLGLHTPLVVDVTDDAGLRAVFLSVALPALRTTDAAWDGEAFGLQYAGSSVVAITGGFRFTLRRASGWIGNVVRFKAKAVDIAGNSDS